MIVGLCDRFHKLPEEIMAADVRLLYYLDLLSIAAPKDKGPDG